MAADDSRPVAVIGAPLDLGQDRRGVDMGPSAIRYAGLDSRLGELGRSVADWGNVETAVAEAADEGEPNARFLGPVLRTCERIAALVRRAAESGATPIVLGGDHSVALGSIGGLASLYGAGGVLWIDAHGDLNTPETTPSGNVHGMVLASVLGLSGPSFESAGLAAARRRSAARCAGGRPLTRRGRAGSREGARHEGLHDERRRQARRRARDPRLPCASRRPRLRARQPRHGRSRP